MEEFITDTEISEPESNIPDVTDREPSEEASIPDFTSPDTATELQVISYQDLASIGMNLSLRVCGIALVISLGVAVIIKILKIS